MTEERSTFDCMLYMQVYRNITIWVCLALCSPKGNCQVIYPKIEPADEKRERVMYILRLGPDLGRQCPKGTNQFVVDQKKLGPALYKLSLLNLNTFFFFYYCPNDPIVILSVGPKA